ncbi:hypothetical protein RvY_10339 [Ramazzottius varieornatus]|uniref:Ig-like domain-containing protein n=1 Tax=Ramazzottius varieornatus TaxID=947166 RepID=A0A1D1VEW6_RAMVA|nr:hypothetical protein RvY_10339 [Ramazzottius varieornatus]
MDSVKQLTIASFIIIVVTVLVVRGAQLTPTQVVQVIDVPATAHHQRDWERVALGEEVRSSCLQVSQTWMRNGAKVAEKGDVSQTGTALIIKNFSEAYAGRYDCVEPDGVIGKSYTFYQNVSISDDTPAEVELTEGMIGGIACQILGGGNLSKTLYRVENSSSRPVDFVNGNFEWTRKVEKGDAGLYVCSGTQTIEGDSKTVNKTIVVRVTFAPEILPVDVLVSGDYPDRSITLSCPVVAVPAASLRWFNVSSGTEQELSEAALIVDGNVTFPMSNSTDTVVKCTATNAVGDSSRIFTVPHFEPNRENVYPNVTSTYKNVKIGHGIKGENGTIVVAALAYKFDTNGQDVAVATKGPSSQMNSAAASRFSAFLGLLLMVVFAF